MSHKKQAAAVSALLIAAISAFGYFHHEHENARVIEEYSENLEALASFVNGSGGQTVSCYCTKPFGKICSAKRKGSYCGGDPCSNHDGNCR